MSDSKYMRGMMSQFNIDSQTPLWQIHGRKVFRCGLYGYVIQNLLYSPIFNYFHLFIVINHVIYILVIL